MKKFFVNLVVVLGVLLGLAEIALSQIRFYKDWLIDTGWIDDKFAIGNLQASPNWGGYEFLPGLILVVGVIICHRLYKNRGNLLALPGFFIFTILFTSLSMIMTVPRVEEISQNAAISFYKERQEENAYFETLGFKSYAHLFYTQKKPPVNEKSRNKQWLLKGEIDKPAYFVIKNTKKDFFLDKYKGLEVIYEKNGFVFTVRYPENNKINDQ